MLNHQTKTTKVTEISVEGTSECQCNLGISKDTENAKKISKRDLIVTDPAHRSVRANKDNQIETTK